jgi:hypothetical protein
LNALLHCHVRWMSPSIIEPPPPHSLTRTASGISVNWKEGDNTIDKNKIKELELAKMSHRESTAIGTSHAFDILGEYLHANSVSPFLKIVGTGPTLQTSHSLIVPQHSEPIEEGVVQPPLPKPTDVVRPAGEPPHSWNLVPSTEGASCKDGTALSQVNITCPPAQSGARVVARQQAATLAKSGVSTVEETRNPRKRGAADQLIGTRKAAKTTQGSACEHVERAQEIKNLVGGSSISGIHHMSYKRSFQGYRWG